MNYILSKEIKDLSIAGIGDTSKIIETFNKAEKGEDIKIAFLGGSITQGCNADVHENCYAYLTYLWFKNKFQNSKVKYINAGVGATGSVIGVHRVERDVLAFNPDIVFIDFAVNDKDDNYCKITYESLIRRILLWKEVPGIIEVFMSNQALKNTQKQQIEIGRKYNVSMISYRDVLKKEIDEGKLKWEDVQSDEVHPNNYGHHIISQLLINFLEGVYSSSIKGDNEEASLGEPLFGDKYLNGFILNNKNTVVLNNHGFEEDKEGFQVFNDGWKFVKNNGKSNELEVEIEGTNIFLLYKKSIKETIGKICVKCDDSKETVLDCYFKDGWGDFSEKTPIVEGDQKSKHKITIRAIDGEVYIMGFLVS